VTSLTDAQLRELQEVVAWETAMPLPDGRILGIPGKRGAMTAVRDPRVRLVIDRLDPEAKTILEFGCHEGNHTVQLAEVAREVVAVEVRPKNVAAALVRLWAHDVRNARIVLKDVREIDERFGAFDILFHVGVLYHLDDPVEHVFRIARMAPALVLDTHYTTGCVEERRSDLERRGRVYRACLFDEGGWESSFSGVEPASRWLFADSLMDLLADAGFHEIDVVSDRVERNGPRLTLVAQRRAGS
jgi:tRNA (mo5U34)-methyltransferase